MYTTRVEGFEADGTCGVNCIVTIAGDEVAQLSPGDWLSVSAPQVSSSWSETFIAVLRVTNVEDAIAFAQVVMEHIRAKSDSSKKISENLRVARINQADIIYDQLAPTFGDGFIMPSEAVFVKQGVELREGDFYIVLQPQYRGQRIIDYVEGPLINIVRKGRQGTYAQYEVVGNQNNQFNQGDIIQWKGTSQRSLISRLFIGACIGLLALALVLTVSPDTSSSIFDLLGFLTFIFFTVLFPRLPFVGNLAVYRKRWVTYLAGSLAVGLVFLNVYLFLDKQWSVNIAGTGSQPGSVPQNSNLVVTYPFYNREEIWVLMRQDRNGKYFPFTSQLSPPECIPQLPTGTNGRYEIPIRVGEPEDIDQLFDIVVFTASTDASQSLKNTLTDWCERQEYPGLVELPQGLSEKVRVTVRRTGELQ